MSVRLPKSSRGTSAATPSTTSLLESACGLTRLGRQAGQTTDPCGPHRVLVNPSALPVLKPEPLTLGICGLKSTGSRASRNLTSLLVSRSVARLGSTGSILYQLTWKERRTPAGRLIVALRARADRRILDSGFTGWPSPTKADGAGSRNLTATRYTVPPSGVHTGVTLTDAASLAGWPTPAVSDTTGGGQGKRADGRSNLNEYVMLAGWPSPQSRDWKSGQISAGPLEHNVRPLSEAALLSGWATPRTEDSQCSGMRHSRGVADTLTAQSSLSGWATPQTRDHFPAYTDEYIAAKKAQGHGMQNLNDQAASAVIGPGPIGYLLGPNGWEIVPASGQLSAAFSRCLMGLPPQWCVAAILAWRSLRQRTRRVRHG